MITLKASLLNGMFGGEDLFDGMGGEGRDISGDEGEEDDPYADYMAALENGEDADEAYAAYMDAIGNEGNEGEEELDLNDCDICIASEDMSSCWTTCLWAD